MILANAFSLNMLKGDATLQVRKVSVEEARALLAPGFVSAVGHQDTANILTDLLGVPVAANRTNVALGPGDKVLVAQYRGPRLPEGATRLPEGAIIEFFLVVVE